MIVVANAGPLIALAQIGQIDLLPALYGRIVIPQAVQREVTISGYGRPGAEEFQRADWIVVNHVQDKVAVQLLSERLDQGESEAIALALELRADLLLIDEARGRRVAEARGLHKTGTLGTLIAAQKRGLVSNIHPLLDALVDSGFYMSEELYQTVLSLVGGPPEFNS
jgi:uncharacterized protein